LLVTTSMTCTWRFTGFLVSRMRNDDSDLQRYGVASLLMVGIVIFWFAYYACTVLPALKKFEEESAFEGKTLNSQQYMILTARIIIFFVFWYCLAQTVPLLPCGSSCRNGRFLSQMPSWRALCIRFFLDDGPLHVHGLFNLTLFGLWFSNQTHVQEDAGGLSDTIKMYLCSNITVWACGHIHLFLRHSVTLPNGRSSPPSSRGMEQDALTEIMNRLESCTYDDRVVGEVDGEIYPGVCAVCLGEWELTDTMKVMPCRHVFHEECIRSWLQSSKTCATCRLDVVEAMQKQ